MKILFIKLKNIGDALIMTPALAAARERYPQAQIDVLVRGATEGILKGSLAINDIYTSAAPEAHKRASGQWIKDLALIARLRKNKYDWIFDLSDNARGRIMTALIGAPQRATHRLIDFPMWARPIFNHLPEEPYGKMHRCQKDVDVVAKAWGVALETAPMQFDRSFADWSWAQKNITEPPIVVHAVTRWQRKMWEVAKWQELVKRLADVAPIVLTSGPSTQEVELTAQIAAAAPGRTQTTGGQLSWAQMAGILYSSRLLVSVDTATMHLGAACQVPLVALLGPTLETQWGPWKCPHRLIVPADHPQGPTHRRLTTVAVEPVWQACCQMLEEQAR